MNYYLGIWYKSILEQTVVWVANRDYPFTDSSVALIISTEGNLVIVKGKISYTLTNISPNGSTSATLLDSGNLVLRDETSDPIKHGTLNWELRVNITEGIAQVFLYLHQYSRLQIMHRDLKASNILLDMDMNPKISNFWTARIFAGNGSQATNRIVGTYGYMSPKYALDGLFSIKSDVFSFGVLLLEILSGKKNTSFYLTDSVNLLGYAWDLWKSGIGQNLKDPILGDIPSTHMLLRYINIGLLCVQESAADKPTMSSVVSMLSNELVLLPSPKQPAFSTITSVPDRNLCKSPERCSLNNVMVSILEPR
ncbi:hypothetical protein TEA_019618 [Camellia sinensis var. sinensis]|uniref:Protein kinase domain-containing protein n=1 Tax=Camellia sinensis var. sinensis TaxID=542762 RepID=A0A4S4EYC2_CAMSN|nr:hypothetical protein TEA_019618 [Camellia sinensis var. sinensis]